MTIFDRETDDYLERIGATPPADPSWPTVQRRARALDRRRRRLRTAALGAAAAAAAAGGLLGGGVFGGVAGPSIVDKAEAAILQPQQPAAGTIEHVLVQYRDGSGHPFIVYESWLAGDGSWCKRTVEGTPSEVDTRLTECRTAAGTLEVYLPSTGEILRARGAATPNAHEGSATATVGGKKLIVTVGQEGGAVFELDGKQLTTDELNALPLAARVKAKQLVNEAAQTAGPQTADPGPMPKFLTEDVADAFRKSAVREDGTQTLDGKQYVRLVTADGLDTVLVDPQTGEAVAWIPPAGAFGPGTRTIVVRTTETLPDGPAARHSMSLAELHPDATVRDVSPAELERAIAAQFPNG